VSAEALLPQQQSRIFQSYNALLTNDVEKRIVVVTRSISEFLSAVYIERKPIDILLFIAPAVL
jgi:hypothetical protein